MNRSNTLTRTKYNFNQVNHKLIALNAILLVGFFAVQILVTSHFGTKTQEIDMTRGEMENLRQENKFIEAEIARAKSLASTQDVIEKYKLVEKNVTFLEEANFDGLALNL